MSGTLREALARHLEPPFVDVDASRLARFGAYRHGKVRDIFTGTGDHGGELLMVTTDRLSAFDVVLTSIPCKGQILNAIAARAFEATRDICPNHLIAVPHPNVFRVRRAEPLPIEVVVRRYVTGSLWRDVLAGRHDVYEITLPAGIRKDARLDAPIITPSTKAEVGIHDEPLSRSMILDRGLVREDVLDRTFEVALRLFARGEELAARRGLILVDTKYEFGRVDDELIVIDELHTADSSRYWMRGTYEARFAAGEPQEMLDKEKIRQWLIAHGFSGEGTPPTIPDDVRLDLAMTYGELYARLCGAPFRPPDRPVQETLYRALGI